MKSFYNSKNNMPAWIALKYCKRPYEEISSVDKYLNTKTEQLRKIQGIKNSPLVPWWFRTVF